MRILGIDPGTARLGYGVISTEENVHAIEFGVIETESTSPMAQRLYELHTELLDVIREYQPDVMAVERLFFARNVTTAITVGQARGVVLLAAAQCGIESVEYTPAEIKLSVAGAGNADKRQVQEMVRILLDLEELPQPDDAADALAIALCHQQHAQFYEAVNQKGHNS